MLRTRKLHKSVCFIKPKFNTFAVFSITGGANGFRITFSSKNWKLLVNSANGKKEIKSTTIDNVTVRDAGNFTLTGDLSQITGIDTRSFKNSINLKDLTLLPSLINADFLNGATIGDVANIGNMANFYLSNDAGVKGLFGDLSEIGNISNELTLISKYSVSNTPSISGLFGWLKQTNKPKIIQMSTKANVTFDPQYMFNSDFDSFALDNGYPLSSEIIDTILINMAASITQALGRKVISLLSANKRTVASDAAVLYLTGLGFIILN